MAALEIVPKIVGADGDMSLFWLGPWEEVTKSSFATSIIETIRELLDDIEKLRAFEGHGTPKQIYDRAVTELGARDPASRGSGTKTALLAAFAANLANNAEPLATLVLIANALGSDTDSIGTMAGAIVGVFSDSECQSAIQDRSYIDAEAQRLAAVASKSKAETFRYPDLRNWKPPRAAVDAVCLNGDGLWLNGLGDLSPLDERRVKTGDDALIWCRLGFGQTILARVRSKPHVLSRQETKSLDVGTTRQRETNPPSRLRDLFNDQSASLPNESAAPGRAGEQGLNETLQQIINERFAPDLIGRAILQQADGRGDFVERGIALTATILTAFEARVKRSRKL